MMIVVPEAALNARYYAVHVMYFRYILDHLKIPYVLKGLVGDGGTSCPSMTKFLLQINDKRIVMDFSDHPDFLENWDSFDAYFKFHYTDQHSVFEKIHPFAPVSFYDWDLYSKLGLVIKYTCNSDFVLNMQRPGGSATERRIKVQEILKSKYGDRAHTHIIQQTPYWTKINDCLVHVFVPGARNDMIDRGHLQYLAFGCCTISPMITDILPYHKRVEPNVHYISCNSDYSDLIEKIEWCKSNRNACIGIGLNAKNLFEDSCTPQKLWKWINDKI